MFNSLSFSHQLDVKRKIEGNSTQVFLRIVHCFSCEEKIEVINHISYNESTNRLNNTHKKRKNNNNNNNNTTTATTISTNTNNNVLYIT